MLTLWRPYEELLRWSKDWDRWWADSRASLRPAVDVEEDQQRYVIRADLPGAEEKDIDVHIEDGVLVLAAQRALPKDEKSARLGYAERPQGSFYRQFTLGNAVDQSKIEASYKNGVLTVALPKKAAAVPRQIPVHAS